MNGEPVPETSEIECRLSELAESFVQEYRDGKRPTVEAYADRHPELAVRLRQLLPTLMVVEELGPLTDHEDPNASLEPSLRMPERLGDYRILREIGRGGMGIVFEAEQISLARPVALKLLGHHAALDPRLIERFQVEARSAACLHHPRIIPVYDVGQADGFHYYAMQLIDGRGLDQVLTELQTGGGSAADRTSMIMAAGMSTVRDGAVRLPNNVVEKELVEKPSASLSTNGRHGPHRYYRDIARIGLHVAESLSYAHSTGILHRDIKPSNLILDRRGDVWVADFGLAKAFDTTDRKGLTATGDIVGTMRYMAPERFRGWSDPRSDVYGLGITLYELLTTQPAFDADDRVMLMEQVQNQTPRPPRTVDRRIPLDLETIVLTAIDKEPGRRYATADDFAVDLRNFLEYRPIKARRASVVEVARQWCRRNPVVASLTATLLVAILFGLVSTTVLWRQTAASLAAAKAATQEKDAALVAEARRRKQAREALDAMSTQVIEEWLTRQSELSPDHTQFLQTTLSHYEDFASDTGREQESRAGVANAHWRVGKIRKLLGQRTEAEAALRCSRDEYAALVEDFPGVPYYRQQLAESYHDLSELLRVTGRPQEAEETFQQGLVIVRQLAADFPDVPAHRQRITECLTRFGILLRDLGRETEAEDALVQALEVAERLADDFPTDPAFRAELGSVYLNLGNLLDNRKGRQRDLAEDNSGKLKRSIDCQRRAVAIYQQLVADFPQVPVYRSQLATSSNNLGNTLRDTERHSEAEEAFRQSLTARNQLVVDFPAVPEYRTGLAMALNNLGILFKNTGRFPEAEEVCGESLAIHKRLAADFPDVPNHQNETAGAMITLARVLLIRTDFEGARRLLEEALPYHRAALKANPSNPTYRYFYRVNRWRMAEAFLGLEDHVAAADVIRQFLDTAVEPPRDAYIAAGLLAGCVRLAEQDERLPGDKRNELSQSYGDRAIAALRQAIEQGAEEVAEMKTDAGLDPLRPREDFKLLEADIETIQR